MFGGTEYNGVVLVEISRVFATQNALFLERNHLTVLTTNPKSSLGSHNVIGDLGGVELLMKLVTLTIHLMAT